LTTSPFVVIVYDRVREQRMKQTVSKQRVQPNRGPRKLRNLLIICAAAVVSVAFIYGAWRLLGWYIAPETATDRKDHILVLAVGLGAVGAIITAIIGWRVLKESQRSTETTIANTRAIEEERAQNDALQKYLEQMEPLLTKEGLRSSEEGSDVRVLARSQTLTALQGLGPNRKHILLRFLYESHLIDGPDSIISLAGADLEGADLEGADLKGANLKGANLKEANLWEVDLKGAILTEANMIGAEIWARLEGANLKEANLGAAKLSGSNLKGADLRGAKLECAELERAKLEGADLRGADLTFAKLEGATLEGAKY
jgi:hypothetical protein